MKGPTTKPNPVPPPTKNPLLSDADQDRDYVVKAFVLQPEVTILTADGKEERRYLPLGLSIHEAQMGDTLPGVMEKFGLKMRQGGGN